jgi:hypothetical protein
MSNPYNTPTAYSTSKSGGQIQPAVVTWYRVYAVFMCLVYLLCFCGGILLAMFAGEIAENQSEEFGLMVQGIVMAVIGVPFAGMYLFGLFTSRSKFGWIWGIVLIAIGLTSCCTLPVTIPLLIYWLKDDNKAWHNLPSA